jgi:hypothetical protein
MSDTSRRALLALGVLAACALSPAAARAWTRTGVEHVEAQLHVDAAARARVAILLDVRVAGGWLSRFEITGVDAATLDAEHPPELIAEDGRRYAPEVERGRDGSVVLVFGERRDAPRRGVHRISLAYSQQLEADGKQVRWSLPPWSVDLEDVRVLVDAPAGSQLGPEREDDVAVVRERRELGERVLLSFRRAQLPRTLPFAVEFELAREVTAPDAAGVAPPDAARTLAPPSPELAWTCALVLLLCWLKRRAVAASGARFRVRPVPLVALHPALRASAMLALALGCCFAYAAHATLGLSALAAAVALAFDRGFARAAQAAPAAAAARRRRSAAHARFQAWLGPSAWLDATTPLGAGLLASVYALAGLRFGWNPRPGLWLEALLLVTPLWLTATRLHLPRPAEARAAAATEPGPAADDITAGATAPSAPLRRAAEARPAPDRAA